MNDTNATHWSATFAGVQHQNQYTIEGDLDTFSGIEYTVEDDVTLVVSDQYTCQVFISDDSVGLIDASTQTPNGSCRFNLGVTTATHPFPNTSGGGTIISGDETTATTTAIVDVFAGFLDSILFDKFPFSWYVQGVDVIREASLLSQDTEIIEISLDFIAPISQSTTSQNKKLDFFQYKTELANAGVDDMTIQPIELGCDALVFDSISFDSCAFFKVVIGYFLFIMLIMFIGKLVWSFFKPAAEA